MGGGTGSGANSGGTGAAGVGNGTGGSAANGANGTGGKTGGKSDASPDGQPPCAEIIHRDQEAQSGGGDVKLPSSYDYRKMGRAPQIGNQGSLGTCWAFASLTALESSLLPTDRETFAVDHMTMHNSFLLGQDEGGEYTMAIAQVNVGKSVSVILKLSYAVFLPSFFT